MTMACGEKIFYECVACVCLFLVNACFMALGFLMGVMTISFALPIDLYECLWIQKKVSLQKFYFKRYYMTGINTMTV